MACMVTLFASLEGRQSHSRCWPQLFLPDSPEWKCQHQVVTDCRLNFFTSSICLLTTILMTLFLFLTLLHAAVITGGSAGLSSRIPVVHRSPARPRASSSSGAMENGIVGSSSGARIRGVMPDRWEQAFSDPGESHYVEWVSTCVSQIY